jgi:hypothetical protein
MGRDPQFPLYADALPYLVTKAFTVIASRSHPAQVGCRKRFVAIVNSGFPEMHQNAVALAICREFALQCTFSWAGGLAFGAGGMIGVQPLNQVNRPGPPVRHVIEALEITAAALAAGLPVPREALRMIGRKAPFFNRVYARQTQVRGSNPGPGFVLYFLHFPHFLHLLHQRPQKNRAPPKGAPVSKQSPATTNYHCRTESPAAPWSLPLSPHPTQTDSAPAPPALSAPLAVSPPGW